MREFKIGDILLWIFDDNEGFGLDKIINIEEKKIIVQNLYECGSFKTNEDKYIDLYINAMGNNFILNPSKLLMNFLNV